MVDDLGQEIEQREYNLQDMDRLLVLNQRTKLVAQRVMKHLMATDPFAKTIIFCEDIDHAERMRVAIVNAAGQLALDNPRYVVRITGDSPDGKAELDNFVMPDKPFPVIATTSELLTTGVDATTCKLIVLDKIITSMTTFKQIIGRGTRIDEEHNKYFFTIMDFKRATVLFRDPDFDGNPIVIIDPDDPEPIEPEPIDPDDGDFDDGDDDDEEGGEGVTKIRVSGVSAKIIAERIEYIGPDGTLITESYRDFTRKQIHTEFASLDEFLRRWNHAAKKQAIIDLLEEYGIILDNLAEEIGREFDAFDLICHIAYDQRPLTRKERANQVRKRDYFTQYGDEARAVLTALLDKYANEGIGAIESAQVLKLRPFNEIGTPLQIINDVFGGKENYDSAIQELERELFNQETA